MLLLLDSTTIWARVLACAPEAPPNTVPLGNTTCCGGGAGCPGAAGGGACTLSCSVCPAQPAKIAAATAASTPGTLHFMPFSSFETGSACDPMRMPDDGVAAFAVARVLRRDDRLRSSSGVDALHGRRPSGRQVDQAWETSTRRRSGPGALCVPPGFAGVIGHCTFRTADTLWQPSHAASVGQQLRTAVTYPRVAMATRVVVFRPP